MNTDLGQHFLTDEDALEAIVTAADIDTTDHVVEIGPGIGILTKELLERAGHVTAIEIDRRLPPLLKAYVGKHLGKLTLIEQNALEVELPPHPYKIVANIPYHITSPLLRHVFLESPVPPKTITMLLQREVAEKICDQDNKGLLTILVALFGKAHLLFRVPKNAFLPPPKVDSAVVHIECFQKPITDKETIDRIFSLTKIAFSQKRKMLRNSLGKLPDRPNLLEEAQISPERRPETLSIEEWILLAQVPSRSAPL